VFGQVAKGGTNVTAQRMDSSGQRAISRLSRACRCGTRLKRVIRCSQGRSRNHRMKPAALSRFRNKLQSDEPVYGLWVTLEAAAVTEIAVGLGLHWVVIDAEHGHLDWAEMLEHVHATVRSNTVTLVGLAEADPALIHRALDLGADGVVIPRIETA